MIGPLGLGVRMDDAAIGVVGVITLKKATQRSRADPTQTTNTIQNSESNITFRFQFPATSTSQ
ncbi:hypothetical protein FRX31_020285 [Thalictrum thalictroides]|uniref:Uncharacterized protein n=1 Tax=Thalictrum thalictroides TaxID=46969 RepID=A0A7J6W034_THATH|nr:hypothetical protein FRX31_020285 [Thalictrum thalictroides]